MPAAPIEPKAYTVKAFCHAYGVGRTKLYAEIKAGRIAVRKFGTRTLIDAGEAARWWSSLSGRVAA
jgi:hypothetical protein